MQQLPGNIQPIDALGGGQGQYLPMQGQMMPFQQNPFQTNPLQGSFHPVQGPFKQLPFQPLQQNPQQQVNPLGFLGGVQGGFPGFGGFPQMPLSDGMEVSPNAQNFMMNMNGLTGMDQMAGYGIMGQANLGMSSVMNSVIGMGMQTDPFVAEAFNDLSQFATNPTMVDQIDGGQANASELMNLFPTLASLMDPSMSGFNHGSNAGQSGTGSAGFVPPTHSSMGTGSGSNGGQSGAFSG